jgi:uncharacterized lipoprotein
MRLPKVIKVIFSCILVLFTVGCNSVNQAATNYVDAKELPPLKFPAGSLAVSHRYDIPEIPGNKEQIITEIVPPDA